jgi:hypothetical protein
MEPNGTECRRHYQVKNSGIKMSKSLAEEYFEAEGQPAAVIHDFRKIGGGTETQQDFLVDEANQVLAFCLWRNTFRI